MQKLLPLFLVLNISRKALFNVAILGGAIALNGALKSSNLKQILVYSSVLGLA